MVTIVVTDMKYNDLQSGVGGSYNTMKIALGWIMMTYMLRRNEDMSSAENFGYINCDHGQTKRGRCTNQ